MTINNKIKRFIRNVIILIASLVIIFSGYKLYELWSEQKTAHAVNDELVAMVDDQGQSSVVVDEIKHARLKEINNDFVGWVSFDSRLVNEPVVFSGDNSTYLTKSFYGKYSSMGTVFMDANQTINNQNVTLYGHYVYRDTSLMFSPLHELTKQENYEQHRFFNFSTETETRRYEVAYVFFIDVADDVRYYLPEYSPNQFDTLINQAKQREFYSTGVSLSREDRFMTLQTCVRDKDDLRLIIIGKEVSVTPNQG